MESSYVQDTSTIPTEIPQKVHTHTKGIQYKLILLAILLYSFLVGVKTLESSFKVFGSDFAHGLFNLTTSPFIGLMSGMLATVLFQSSSVTTSIIVGLVSSGTLPIAGAIPMIMGANLGTSVTNTFVSLGHLKETQHYKRAFAAATIHDFFNILSVLVLLPIELATGFLQKLSTTVANLLYGNIAGLKYSSPIKSSLKPIVGSIKSSTAYLAQQFNWSPTLHGTCMAIFAAIIIVSALTLIVRTMKPFVESHKGDILNKFLSQNTFMTVIFGTIITMAVQSSSITTSLLVPMAGAGLLQLQVIFPITIGANIGTTTTALIAALAGNAAGLSIALVHFFFNILGALIWFAPPQTRKLPLWLATKLSSGIEKSKLTGPVYIAVIFFALPISMIYLNQ